MESPDSSPAPEVPPVYQLFQEVFCPRQAAKLPPHFPWDCTIDLIPGGKLPAGRIYPLSIPKQKAMQKAEALSWGYIRASTSPAASSFFFVEMDGGQRPCIDYWT